MTKASTSLRRVSSPESRCFRQERDRTLNSQRAMLVEYAARHIQHMQKALTQMNVKLHQVISDITGKTGMAIVEAIVGGERDPRKLARLRDPRTKADEAAIARSLEGHWREEHIFELTQALELYRVYAVLGRVMKLQPPGNPPGFLSRESLSTAMPGDGCSDCPRQPLPPRLPGRLHPPASASGGRSLASCAAP